MTLIFYAATCLLVAVLLVVTVATIILLERKLLALSQRRVGPAILGRRGILQIVADVIKPLFKDIFESKLQTVTIVTASVLLLLLTQLVFSSLFQYKPGDGLYKNIEAVVYLQSVFSSAACLSVLIIGYLSGSKYGMLGAVRLAVSELSNDTASFVINAVILYATSGFDYESVCAGQGSVWGVSTLAVVYAGVHIFHVFIAAQRSPLDLIEVEGELVAGYNTEYSGADVLVIYFAEYFHLFNAAVQFVFIVFGAAFVSAY
jgi:NADH:ubiquinone oxidoreductase subunit H